MADVLDKPIEITLGDGSKIVGATLEEALNNAKKRVEDTTAALKAEREAKTKLEGDLTRYKETEEERKAEEERQAEVERQRKAATDSKEGKFSKDQYYRLLNDDPLAAANYLDAHRLGIPDPNQVPQRFNSMAAQISEINQERVASAFWRQHPEFPQEITAARALDKRVSQLLNEGYPFTVRTFNIAYDELVGEDTIKPIDLEAKNKEEKAKEEESRPNPSLSGSGATSADDELRKIESMDEKALEAYGRSKGFIR